MKIAIIACDQVDSHLVEEYGDYPQMFSEWLLKEDPNLSITAFNALELDLPSTQDFDGYLITGSRHNAHDNDPWILNLIDWIVDAKQQGCAIAGICFGHQLLTRALGGITANTDRGWGLGTASNQLISAPDWVAPSDNDSTEEFNLYVSHQDQVIKLPAKAKLLAKSSFCPNFMYQLDQQIFAVQGHPEFVPGYAKYLIDKRVDILPEAVFEAAQASLAKPADASLVFHWIVELYRSVKAQR